jgi:hypothetical protein
MIIKAAGRRRIILELVEIEETSNHTRISRDEETWNHTRI